MTIEAECRACTCFTEVHPVDMLCWACFGGFTWWCYQRGVLARRIVTYPEKSYAIDVDDTVVSILFDEWLEKGRPGVEDKQWRDFGREVRTIAGWEWVGTPPAPTAAHGPTGG